MSAKAIREYHGKQLLAKFLNLDARGVLVTPEVHKLQLLPSSHPWLKECQLVVKPDQLIKRRGKSGLVGVNLNFDEVVDWINARRDKEQKVERVSGKLDHFIIEPFLAHEQDDEYYICIQSEREGDEILFSSEGGVDVGDVDSKASRLFVHLNNSLSVKDIYKTALLHGIPDERLEVVAAFVCNLLKVFRDLNFTYMEINPVVVTSDNKVTPLDLAAKVDETAHFLNSSILVFPLFCLL